MIAQHILVCCHDFSQGGAEKVAITLARKWLDAGREVTFLVGSCEGGLADQVDPRARIIELTPPIRDSLTSRLRLGRAMARAAPSLAPDAIFLIGNYHFGLSSALRRALPAIPIIAKVSNPLLAGVPWLLHWPAKVLLMRWVRAIDVMVYMAPELAHEGRRLLPLKAREVIAEPNLPTISEAPSRLHQGNRPRVIAIGRLEPQKRMNLAIQAFGEFRKSTDAELVILGEGSERPKLERLVKKLGLADCVHMPGFSSRVNNWLATASALLMSSLFEGYPAAIVEALASDVPVVTTDCSPALSSLIPSPTHGCVVKNANPITIAAALEVVLAIPASSLGARQATVAHNREDTSASHYLELFDRMVRLATDQAL